MALNHENFFPCCCRGQKLKIEVYTSLQASGIKNWVIYFCAFEELLNAEDEEGNTVGIKRNTLATPKPLVLIHLELYEALVNDTKENKKNYIQKMVPTMRRGTF